MGEGKAQTRLKGWKEKLGKIHNKEGGGSKKYTGNHIYGSRSNEGQIMKNNSKN